MAGRMLQTLDGLLRGRSEAMDLGKGAAVLVVCGGFYGAVMGSFWGDEGPRLQQMAYSAAKVPLLVGATFALSLPAFFVVSTLIGLRDDFAESVRALMATQAVLAILLASFAPFTLLWYASTKDYSGALLFNTAMFALASVLAQRVLARLFQPLVAHDPRQKVMLRVWLVAFAFVGIQMGWVLRPFVGNPAEPTTFFRQEAWGNAYEMVAQHIRRALGW